jgi:hypothetical protein
MEDSDGIIAYCGLMPFKFFVCNQDYDGYVYHDSMVDPKYRGRGLGTHIVKCMVDRKKTFSLAVWMNAPNARVFEKCGWKPVRGIHTFVRRHTAKGFNKTPSALVNRTISSVADVVFSAVYLCEKAFWRFGKQGPSVKAVETFDDRVDSLFDSVKKSFACITYRSHSVLNWCYSNRHFSGYRKFICEDESGLLGYIVFRTKRVEERTIATIYDYLCSPDRPDVFKRLLRTAIRVIEEEKTDSIEIIGTQESMRAILKRHAFFKGPENRFALKYIHESQLREHIPLSNGSKWHFTHGDGDRLFWEF